ncbi:MAG: hypothetical protein IJX08_08005 [Clostridia bacterium]|nr:hypothetical protein [Clostridia bacterium]
MSGLFCDGIISYGVTEQEQLFLEHCFYFPTLRTIPNNTHATYCFTVKEDQYPRLMNRGTKVLERPLRFTLDGTLLVECQGENGLYITRRFYPTSAQKCFVEQITLSSSTDQTLTLSLPSYTCHTIGRGTKGVYLAEISHTANDMIELKAGESYTFGVFYSARIANEERILPDARSELDKRMKRVEELCDDALVFRSGIEELDTMTRFAKLRAAESIFETLSGKFHSPGGRAYYAAIWCNDQIEYAGPHFAMTADTTAIDASFNAYKAYIPFMSESYHRLPSSIIAEGLDIWEGAGDRGDAAMYLYGASLFCLYLGDEQIAKELYPAIKWCAEYCERKKSPEGVICSDTDELEGRFPTDGYANLSTSCLCYGGLLFAAKLAHSLGDIGNADLYTHRAANLKNAIEEYFGHTLHGYETYRYSKGFETLRAWICLPLCMGLDARAAGTLDAMLSPYLWTEEGMLTCEISSENQSNTIWDRSTLYGIKSAFIAGAGDRIMPFFLAYCRKRLLGERVPYAVEAYPEGSMRHLSGESALFVRIITEGIFGIVPESLTSFSFVPQLPKGIPFLKLSSLHICGSCFEINIDAQGWTVSCEGVSIAQGANMNERIVIQKP